MSRATRVIFLLILLMATSHAQNLPVGRWLSRDGREEVALTLQADGKATWQATHLNILYAQTTDGECIARTIRDEDPPISGSYRLQDGRLLFHWSDAPQPSELFPEEGGEVIWPFQMEGDELRISLPDRQLVLRKEQPH